MAGIDMIQSTRQQGSQEVMLQRDWEELSQNFFLFHIVFLNIKITLKKKKIHYEILNSQLLLVTVKFKAIFNM